MLLAPVFGAPPVQLAAVRPVPKHGQGAAVAFLAVAGPLVQARTPHGRLAVAVDHLPVTGTVPQQHPHAGDATRERPRVAATPARR